MAIFNKMPANRANARIIAAGIVSLLALLESPASWADFYLHGWEGHHEDSGILSLDPQLLFYMSSADFDTSGALMIPAPSASAVFQNYTRAEADIDVAYGLSRRLTLYGRGSWTRVGLSAGI